MEEKNIKKKRGEIAMVKFTRDTIYDIVTCNPFTIRGRDCLKRLGLNQIITEDSFFETGLYIDSKYRKAPYDKGDYEDDKIKFDEDFFDFSADFAALKDYSNIHEKLIDFEAKFFDQASDLLYILGASGSGKSVYVNYLLQRHNKASHNKIFMNLEVSSHSITNESVTLNTPKGSASWLFCLHLIDETCKFIIRAANDAKIAKKVADNFDSVFGKETNKGHLDERYHNIMTNFKKCCKSINTNKKPKTKKELVLSLYSLKDDANIALSIWQTMLILVIFVYCETHNKDEDRTSNNDRMTYLVIDNIEKYIKIRDNKTTEISDRDIRKINNALDSSRGIIKGFFEKCGLEFEKYFKIILVMRHSTLKLWTRDLHTARDPYYHNINKIKIIERFTA